MHGFSGVRAGPNGSDQIRVVNGFGDFSANAGNANEPKRLVFSAFRLIILSSSWAMIRID